MVEELQSGDFVTPTVKLVRPLAQGGMGTVWIAEHLTLDTQVVVKLMTAGVELAEGAASRFAREAAIAAAVKSPHVVQVFDSGTTENGTAFIVMELLEGRDLGAHLQARGRLPPDEVAGILTQLGKALSKAHRVGVIHRDIKPDNVFLCEVESDERFVKLLDFGTAKDGGNAPYSTTLGQLIGTPYYMSPEQILGEPIDHRTDIWSLGVVAYEALTGVRPFDGATVGAVTLAIHTLEPRPSSVVNDLPLTLDEWFAKACARDPKARFQSARAATQAFARAAIGESPLVEDSPESSYDGLPPSSSTLMPEVTSTRSLVSTTTTLSETLQSSRRRERRTMLWIAGLVAVAAVAAMVALVTSDGTDRTTKTTARPAEPPVATAPAPAPSPEPSPSHSATTVPRAPTITAPTTTVVTASPPAMTVQRPTITTAMPPARATLPMATATATATATASATVTASATATATEAPTAAAPSATAAPTAEAPSAPPPAPPEPTTPPATNAP